VALISTLDRYRPFFPLSPLQTMAEACRSSIFPVSLRTIFRQVRFAYDVSWFSLLQISEVMIGRNEACQSLPVATAYLTSSSVVATKGAYRQKVLPQVSLYVRLYAVQLRL
jgi:hypothetical protein